MLLAWVAVSAHPHVCGEHNSVADALAGLDGSSPRVWGAQTKSSVRTVSLRLIPTCVGSTLAGGLYVRWYPAHPHVCGEHNWKSSACSTLFGSSPRVWGAPDYDAQGRVIRRLIPTCVGSTLLLRAARNGQVTFRLIPTCVGSTSPARLARCAAPAHPHVCGEHLRSA